MDLYRIRLRPHSPWRTPWQADTLTGALCATAARTRGADWLRRELLDPMRAGQPPFVLSDALPGEWLPIPVLARLGPLPEGSDRKSLKRLSWVSRDALLKWRESSAAEPFPWQDCAAGSDLIRAAERRHNTLSRENDASLEEGGLFSREDLWLAGGQDDRTAVATRRTRPGAPACGGFLTLYFRARDAAAANVLAELLEELSWTGFGADVATGRGQFELRGDPQRDPELDRKPADAGGVMVLSTFQPGPGDPTDGCWESFPKFAKLGPDFGLDNAQVHKHTLIMLRPGACFRRCDRPWLGWALPMERVLPRESVAELRTRSVDIVHPAFGLTIPIRRWIDA